MHPTSPHYLPLPVSSFSALIGLFLLLLVLLQMGVLGYAYTRLGLRPITALLLLAGSLIGSYFNIPVAQLPAHAIVSNQVIAFFGMRYIVPRVLDWPGTIIAVNVGGAVIPTLVSLYLMVRQRLWIRGPIAVACIAFVDHSLAQPVAGLGIALPFFVPAATSAIVALILTRGRAAALAYIGGSLGTLIGADLTNLGRIQGLGAPVASIGGAGTFDGIFVTGILAVILASLTHWPSYSRRS